MNISVIMKKNIPTFGNNEKKEKKFKTKAYANDSFTKTNKTRAMEENVMSEDLKLTSSIKSILNSRDSKKIASFLDEFSESTTLILRTAKKDDVIAAVQTFIDYASVEKNSDVFDKYISIIHSSICPKTGVGKFVRIEELLKNPLSNGDAKVLIENIQKDSKEI